MKKKIGIICLIIAAMALTGCGSKKDKDEKKAATSSDATASEATGEFKLGQYKGLEANKVIYDVSDDEIQSEIDSLLYDYVDYIDVDRPSQEGDYVNVLFTAKMDGEVVLDFTDEEEGGYDFLIGMADLGQEFDEKLTGVSVGDSKTFEITYPEDYEDTDFAGNTVEYSINVTAITEEVMPELTADLIAELGYESENDMRTKITEELKSSNETYSIQDMRENLIQQVIDDTTFAGYTDEMYNACKEVVDSSYAAYMEMFGCESVEEVYEMFGLTDEDIENEVVQLIYRQMVIDEISEIENITVTDEEYNKRLPGYAELYGYESATAMEATVEREDIRSAMLEDMVIDIIVENATIKELTMEEYEKLLEEFAETGDEELEYEELEQ
ncbi:MAG: FKBP-type peptidyl-prolyl cis-trans isomerase [Clostridium sp.]|nr:FKBP-type peptidyl-prolyl cis-trans isomerase [Clostridium sp.]MCM1398561.1 FKBP-type peptidyl-prolyl cis-trans isomerase [Clostridium sp.]MCM1459849.1 FKBP-type peptidyl-prolyl cis-trans isomerase [Bacteroides sp.]